MLASSSRELPPIVHNNINSNSQSEEKIMNENMSMTKNIKKTVQRPEFKSWTRLSTFLHFANTLEKDMNPILLFLAIGS